MQIRPELSIEHSLCVTLQVSMAVVCEISSELAKSQPPKPPPSAESKKGKDKGKGKKGKDVSLLQDCKFVTDSTVQVFYLLKNHAVSWKASFRLAHST